MKAWLKCSFLAVMKYVKPPIKTEVESTKGRLGLLYQRLEDSEQNKGNMRFMAFLFEVAIAQKNLAL